MPISDRLTVDFGDGAVNGQHRTVAEGGDQHVHRANNDPTVGGLHAGPQGTTTGGVPATHYRRSIDSRAESGTRAGTLHEQEGDPCIHPASV